MRQAISQVEILALLLELAEGCPAVGGNPVDCPLHAWRQFDAVRRLQYVRGLAAEERSQLNDQHLRCYFRRIARQAP